MSTPKRWLDSDEPRGLERSLLEAGAGVRLDPARQARLWQSIAGRLPPPGGDGSGQGTTPADRAPPPAGGSPTAASPPPAAPATPAATGQPASGPPAVEPPTGRPPAVTPTGRPPAAPTAGEGAALAPSAGSGLLGAKGAAWAAVLGLTTLAGYWLADPIGLSPRRPAPAVEAGASPARGEPAAPAATGEPTAREPASPAPSAAPGPPPDAPRRDPAAEPDPARRAADPEPTRRAASGEPDHMDPPDTSAPAAAPPSAAPALTPAEAAAQERANLLREEASMVREARTALRAGDAAGALRRLEQVRARFGGGVMGQEREALTIEALARSGQGEAARARAEAFVKAYPASPHAADVARFAR